MPGSLHRDAASLLQLDVNPLRFRSC